MGKPRKKSRPGSFKMAANAQAGNTNSDKQQAQSSDSQESTEHEHARQMHEQSESTSTGGSAAASDEPWQPPEPDYGSENPQTCCSHCHTIFEVSIELLSSADTRVRCGECRSIFDALANLRDAETDEEDILVDADGNVIEANEPMLPIKRHEQGDSVDNDSYHEVSSLPNAGAAALAGLANDTSSLDVTYSDFDLFSGDAELPEVAYFDQTRDTQSFEFSEVEDADETFSDTLFVEDDTVDASSGTLRGGVHGQDLQNIALTNDVDFIADAAPREPLIFNYRERETKTSSNDTLADNSQSFVDGKNGTTEAHSSFNRGTSTGTDHKLTVPDDKGSPWLFRGGMFFLLLSLAGGLYLYRERDALYANQHIRPALETACSLLNCELPEQVDLSAIKVLKRAVFSHPSIDNALIINLGFVNEAAFMQRYPVLEIRLTDRTGRLVVKNNFFPVDYSDSWQEGDKLDAGKRLDISLTVEDPGNTATSFELDFR
ncbi:MAG: zinc-ribbon and DUF3426 domain-containing protein [Granulosicoccus sp.]